MAVSGRWYIGPMLKWLEISPDYRCNNRCHGCFSVGAEDGPSMSAAEVVENLRLARSQGARWLWLGGGEPTLRRDLLPTIRAARKLGYERVKLQTNGMLLAYPDVIPRLVDAGLTEVNFSAKGATAHSHDALTGTPGCFALLEQAVEAWAKTGLASDGDVLVYRRNLPELVSLVRHFHALGIERFNLWLFSPAGSGDAALREQMPRMSEVAPRIKEILRWGLSERADFLTSLHTPPCTVPAEAEATLFHSAALGLLVANPGGHRFRLETSPIEGGVFLDRCEGCAMRWNCNGLREDYLAIHGDAEFQPLPVRRTLPVLRDVAG